MDLSVYKILHVAGLALLMIGSGAILLGTDADGRRPRGAAALHGLGLLVMLVAGFGMMARLGYNSFPWPAWLFGKLGIWLVLATLPALARRGILRGVPGALLVAALVSASAYLAIYKPGL